MSAPNDGGAAFPVAGGTMPNGRVEWPESGMSLRDYFAAKAMAAIIAMPLEGATGEYIEETVAKSAYAMADAMLAEREKRGA